MAVEDETQVKPGMAQEFDASSDGQRFTSDTHIDDEKTGAGAGAGAGAATAVAQRGDGGAPVKRSKTKVTLIMLSLCIAMFLAALDVTIVTTALPTIVDHFQSPSGYTWIGSAFILGSAAAIPLWGKFSDIFGRKPVLLAANFVFFLGSLLAGISINIGMLIVARAIQGIGAGGLTALVQIVIADLFSQRERGMYYGIIGGVWTIASSLGPIIGGAFTEKVSWRWCFYINLPIDGIAFMIIIFFLDVKTPKTPFFQGIKSIDWVGALLIIGGTIMFLLGLQYGGETFPWKSATVICLIVFGALCMVLFALAEKYVAKYPVVPLRLFRAQSSWAALVITFLHGFTFIASTYYLPFYFQTVYDASPLLSGVYILPLSLALSATSLFTGVTIRKTGKYLPFFYFAFTFMVIGQGLYILFNEHRNFAKVIVFTIIAGLGFGPLFQVPLIAMQANLRPQDIASGTATFGFVRQLATAMGVVVGQVIYQNEMNKKQNILVQALGSRVAALVGGGGAGAQTDLIHRLPPNQSLVLHTAIADSLRMMWILYIVLAFVGLLVSFLVKNKALNKAHTETKTGLEAERANRAEVLAEEEERRRIRREKALSRQGAKGSSNSPIASPVSPASPVGAGSGTATPVNAVAADTNKHDLEKGV